MFGPSQMGVAQAVPVERYDHYLVSDWRPTTQGIMRLVRPRGTPLLWVVGLLESSNTSQVGPGVAGGEAPDSLYHTDFGLLRGQE